jgi:hypothetical protein
MNQWFSRVYHGAKESWSGYPGRGKTGGNRLSKYNLLCLLREKRGIEGYGSERGRSPARAEEESRPVLTLRRNRAMIPNIRNTNNLITYSNFAGGGGRKFFADGKEWE